MSLPDAIDFVQMLDSDTRDLVAERFSTPCWPNISCLSCTGGCRGQWKDRCEVSPVGNTTTELPPSNILLMASDCLRRKAGSLNRLLSTFVATPRATDADAVFWSLLGCSSTVSSLRACFLLPSARSAIACSSSSEDDRPKSSSSKSVVILDEVMMMSRVMKYACGVMALVDRSRLLDVRSSLWEP